MTSFARLLSLAALATLPAWNAVPQPFSIASGTVRVAGTSNVHDWRCTSSRPTGSFQGEANGTSLTSVSNLTVTIPVATLDCRNGTMNSNLRRAMNASAQPTVRFALASATVSGRTISGNGQLTINGTTKPVAIRAEAQAADGGGFRLTGSVPVVMSQFGITPPVAMMGTMRTGDRVTVSFDVVVR
ncbi:MAG: YceI family protein [Rhodothermales bacterium]|nr:YceI family protein [Rhodothermales bacterium]MCA0268117.1 YceI family protein [Bacteroidota bacterium]